MIETWMIVLWMIVSYPPLSYDHVLLSIQYRVALSLRILSRHARAIGKSVSIIKRKCNSGNTMHIALQCIYNQSFIYSHIFLLLVPDRTIYMVEQDRFNAVESTQEQTLDRQEPLQINCGFNACNLIFQLNFHLEKYSDILNILVQDRKSNFTAYWFPTQPFPSLQGQFNFNWVFILVVELSGGIIAN